MNKGMLFPTLRSGKAFFIIKLCCPRTLSANFTATATGDRKTWQRCPRGLMIEGRRWRALWWRMYVTALPMPPPRAAAEGGSQREPMVPSARFFGSFLCETQRNERKKEKPPALWAAGAPAGINSIVFRQRVSHNAGGKTLSSSTCSQVAALAPYHFPRWGRLTSRRTGAAALAKGDARPPP